MNIFKNIGLCFLIAIVFSKNILFVAPPEHSHTHPLPGIASTIENHKLFFAFSSKYKSWTEKFKNSTFFPLDLKIPEDYGISSGHDLLGHIRDNLIKKLSNIYIESYPILEDIINNVEPDIIVVDMFQIAAMDIAKKKNITFIISVNGPPSIEKPYLPNLVNTKPRSDIHIKDKLMNLILPFMLLAKVYSPFSELQKLRKRISGLDVPLFPLHYFEDHVSFHQSFKGFDYLVDYPSRIIHLGGVFSERVIDENVKKVLEENQKKKQRTIYVAFGTIVVLHKWQVMNLLKGILKEPKNNVIFAMKQLSQKHSNVTKEDLENVAPGRVKIFEWVNQPYVLSHPAVDLFVTHSGFQSTIEGIYNEKPMLGHPIFGDQPLNSIKIHDSGIGLYLNSKEYTEKEVYEKVNEILTNPKYKENIRKLNNMRKSYKQARAAEVIEDILLNGDKHYFSIEVEYSYLQRTGLDSILLFVFTLLFGYMVIKKIVFH